MNLVQQKTNAVEGRSTMHEREIYRRMAYIYDLNPEWLDKTFVSGGKTFKLAGLKTRGEKNVIATCNGDTYFFDAAKVCRLMRGGA